MMMNLRWKNIVSSSFFCLLESVLLFVQVQDDGTSPLRIYIQYIHSFMLYVHALVVSFCPDGKLSFSDALWTYHHIFKKANIVHED